MEEKGRKKIYRIVTKTVSFSLLNPLNYFVLFETVYTVTEKSMTSSNSGSTHDEPFLRLILLFLLFSLIYYL